MQQGSSGEAEPLGDLLVAAARKAIQGALLVSPFVKAAVVERMFAGLPADVPVTLVTRWRPEEIASGVSDLEVWDFVQQRDAAELLLEPTLHAKYYRFDDDAFIGSANLTAAGLGWRNPSNIELLERTSPLPDFERLLLSRAIAPTESLRLAISEAAAMLRPEGRVEELELEDAPGVASSGPDWLPETRHPEDLYVAYGGESAALARATRNAARRDLAALDLPLGLSREPFDAMVGTRLLSIRIVGQLDAYLTEVRRFGEVRDWLAEELDLTRDEASTAWQTLMRWLTYFTPTRYESTRPQYTEGLRRVGE